MNVCESFKNLMIFFNFFLAIATYSSAHLSFCGLTRPWCDAPVGVIRSQMNDLQCLFRTSQYHTARDSKKRALFSTATCGLISLLVVLR